MKNQYFLATVRKAVRAQVMLWDALSEIERLNVIGGDPSELVKVLATAVDVPTPGRIVKVVTATAIQEALRV